MILTKKIISFITATTLAFSFASTTLANASEDIDDIIYVDGHGFKVSVSLSGDTIIESIENASKLVMDENGETDIILEDTNGIIEKYDAEINELTEENVDIVIKQSDEIVEEINSYDELVEDNYEGQAAAAGVLITADLLLTALAIAAITIVICGVTCYAVNEIEKQIKKSKNNYYYAYLRSGVVYINPLSVSESDAIKCIKNSGDDGGVYTYLKDNAKYIAQKSTRNWRGPENHYRLLAVLAGSVYYDHYHNCESGAHIWYGMPKNRKLSSK